MTPKQAAKILRFGKLPTPFPTDKFLLESVRKKLPKNITITDKLHPVALRLSGAEIDLLYQTLDYCLENQGG